jgi:hypothetical protein
MRSIKWILVVMWVGTVAQADGVNSGLTDGTVVPIVRAEPTTGQPLAIGSNNTGRPGVGPDQIAGYDVNIAWDHVAVGAAVIGVLYLMTEVMAAR